MIEIRKNVRVPVSLTSRYRIPTTFDYVEAPLYDLSRGGMFIESDSPAERGTLLKIVCDVLDQEASILGVGRVVWRRATRGAEGPTGMGVKFVKLDKGSERVISQLVEANVGGGAAVRQAPVEVKGVERKRDDEAPVAGDRPTEKTGGSVPTDSSAVSRVVTAAPPSSLAGNALVIGLLALVFLAAAYSIMFP